MAQEQTRCVVLYLHASASGLQSKFTLQNLEYLLGQMCRFRPIAAVGLAFREGQLSYAKQTPSALSHLPAMCQKASSRLALVGDDIAIGPALIVYPPKITESGTS
jgi:hypothetical protein